MVTYVAKGRKAAFLVQRGRSAIFQRWKSHLLISSADQIRLVSSGGRPETGALPVFHRLQEWLRLKRLIIFFNNF